MGSELTHVLSEGQFNQFLIDNPGFNHRKFSLFYGNGETEAVVLLKKWGNNLNLVMYVEFENGELHTCSAYQKDDYYLGLKDIPVGAAVKLIFTKSHTGNTRLDSVSMLNKPLLDLSERYKTGTDSGVPNEPVGTIYTWDDFPYDRVDPKEYHLNKSKTIIEGVVTARRYGEKNNIIVYVNQDISGTEEVDGVKASAYADDNNYLGLPCIPEGAIVRLTYSHSGRYSRLDAVEVIE